MKLRNRGILVVVSGFSGAGKGTLMKELLHAYENYALSISMTTRKPRLGEEESVDYFFVEKKDFEEKIAKDALIEYASYCGNYYGTPKDYVESQLKLGKDVILEIEIQGALHIKEQFKDALLLFVMPPTVVELKRRLEGRGTESEEVISMRLNRAKEEAVDIEKYDYIVINDNLNQCVEELHSIVNAAHHRPKRKKVFIKEIREELNQIASEG